MEEFAMKDIQEILQQGLSDILTNLDEHLDTELVSINLSFNYENKEKGTGMVLTGKL